MKEQDVDCLKSKRICHYCVDESYLNREIRAQGKKRKCSYCTRIAKSYSIGELAERVEEAFDDHYYRTSDQPSYWQMMMISDKESGYDWERDGEPILYAIMNAAEIPEEVADNIQEILEDKHSDFEMATMSEETEFSSESYYEEKDPDDRQWQEEWREFERSLKSEARFFSRAAAGHLASVFDGIDAMKTLKGRPLLINAGPGTSNPELYRARAFQSDEKLKKALAHPDRYIGSPPSKYARAGRMNAHGISVFYGSNDPKLAIAEVRPPVGSRVVVARFEILRPVRLLDLTALGEVSTSGSIFDPAFAFQLERMMFLRSLSHRITRPVMPDDELFEYLPTQAVADFLATETRTQVDGVIFQSSQVPGSSENIVLFHKAAKVEEIQLH